MIRQLIDTRLRHGIPDHWASVCTIQTILFWVSASNQRTPVAYINTDSSMVNIPCRLGPSVRDLVRYDERRTDKTTTLYTQWELLLNDYLPDIQPELQLALVDDVLYLVRGVDTDSQKFTTRLRLEVTNRMVTALGNIVRTPNLSSQLPGSTITLADLPVGSFFQLFRNGLLQDSTGFSRSGLTITLVIPGIAGEILQAFYFSY